MKKIAIQGEIGSFHDIAAHEYFNGEQIELLCCSTFESLFDSIRHDPTIIGMLAIENTIAGSLLHNYELLRQADVTIVGEHKLYIERSEEHTSELQSRQYLVCRLLLEKKKKKINK